MIYNEDGKVEYWSEGYSKVTAYLTASFRAGGTDYFLATGKHSDEQVLLRFSDKGFVEVPL